MLAPVAVWLAKNGWHVSVIGRRMDRLEDLQRKIGKNDFTAIQADYRDKEVLRNKLSAASAERGAFNLVIGWIRSDAESSISEIFKLNCSQNSLWTFLHILGSTKNPNETRNSLKIPYGCIYRQVQLGFKIEGKTSRWLTNEEISEGVISSVHNKSTLTIIGQTEPPDMRPSY